MGSIKLSAHRWLGIGILMLAAIAASATEQLAAPGPCSAELNLPGDEVATRLMSRNAERAQELRHVDSIRQYKLNYTGFPSALSAQMQVKASYTAPGTKQFTVISESGSSLIRKHVLHRLLESEQEASSDAANRDAVALSTANYRFFLLGCEPGDSRPLYVMRVAPLRATKFLYRGTIWIDSQDFAVTRIEAEPAKNPSFWTLRSKIHHEYQKLGEFYLPAFNQTVTDIRFGGKAVLTIQYFDYRLPQQVARVPETRPSASATRHRGAEAPISHGGWPTWILSWDARAGEADKHPVSGFPLSIRQVLSVFDSLGESSATRKLGSGLF